MRRSLDFWEAKLKTATGELDQLREEARWLREEPRPSALAAFRQKGWDGRAYSPKAWTMLVERHNRATKKRARLRRQIRKTKKRIAYYEERIQALNAMTAWDRLNRKTPFR